ncbi:MAG: hypothetical protein ACP5OB_08185, partial [Candidatus Ratteibacteria bacterium]
MKNFKFVVLSLFLFPLLGWTINIKIITPNGAEKLKVPYTLPIQWTADWTGETRTLSEWEVYYSPTGTGQPNNPSNPEGDWVYLGSGGNNQNGGSFNWNIPNVNVNTAKIYIMAYFTNEERSGKPSNFFTIDNTRPNSDILIPTKIKSTGNSYSGSWSDNLSVPIHVIEAKFYANTTNDTSTAVYLDDVTKPDTELTGSNNGIYKGSFDLKSSILYQIAANNYKYFWVRIKIWDDAKDSSDKGNETIDWSNFEISDDTTAPTVIVRADVSNFLLPSGGYDTNKVKYINGKYWFKESVPIIIKISDASGVYKSWYLFEGGGIWYEINTSTSDDNPEFNLKNCETRIKVKAKDYFGNISENFYDVNIGYYDPLGNWHLITTTPIIYVDTFAPKTIIQITSGNYWPKSPSPDPWQYPGNPLLPVPEWATPPSGYPQNYIDYLYFNSDLKTNPTKFKLIVDDTPPNNNVSDGKGSSGISIDFNMPKYRVSYVINQDLRYDTNLWQDWIYPTTNYFDQSAGGYRKAETTEFTLNKNVVAIEYYAMDNVGNEEDHSGYNNKTIELGNGAGPYKRTPTGSSQVDGSANLRADDSVPPPDIEILGTIGENNWYKSSVTIHLVYNDTNNWKDPLLTGELGSGIKKFQYVLKNSSVLPSESEFIDYNYGTPLTLNEGIWYLYYRAIDNIGNISGTFEHNYIIYPQNPIKVDSIKPISNLSLNNGIFTLSATDNLSGVKTLYWKFIFSDNTSSDTYSYNGSSTTFTSPSGTK